MRVCVRVENSYREPLPNLTADDARGELWPSIVPPAVAGLCSWKRFDDPNLTELVTRSPCPSMESAPLSGTFFLNLDSCGNRTAGALSSPCESIVEAPVGE
eukprot:847828-Amorphochlora_amoeboformis.AAC.3